MSKSKTNSRFTKSQASNKLLYCNKNMKDMYKSK